MISTVTTSTVSTVTLTDSLAVIGIVVLLVLLVQKELLSTVEDRRARLASQILNVGIIPLLIAFVLITALKVIEVLR